MLELRPLTAEDDRAVVGLMGVAFADLDRRLGRAADRPAAGDPALAALRVRHLAATDPAGSWAADDDDGLAGATVAILREGIWGLSLLVVHPRAQSTGLGSELLRRALAYGAGARGGIILASEDVRALRLYNRAGFAARPCFEAFGRLVRRPAAPAAVRPGRWPEDRALIDAAGRFVRGAGHGEDVGTMLDSGIDLLVHEAGGFAACRGGDIKLLAADRDEVAAGLLRAALDGTPPDGTALVSGIGQGQDWALSVALEAGLGLRPGGAIFVRGEVGPMRPYLPSGAYL